MAIRIETGEGLLRTSDLLNYNSPYTIMAWFRTESHTTYGTYFNSWWGTYENQDALHRAGAADEVSLEVWKSGAGSSMSGPAIPIGTWTQYAIVRESNTSCKLYVDGALAVTNTYDISGRTAMTEMRIGVTTVNLDARAAAVKAWAAALSAAEVASEYRVIRPLRLAGLHAFWPGFPGSGERTRDYSGNGRHWTEVGTLSDADPPPVAWGAPVLIEPRATGFSGTSWTIPLLSFTTALPVVTMQESAAAAGSIRTLVGVGT